MNLREDFQKLIGLLKGCLEKIVLLYSDLLQNETNWDLSKEFPSTWPCRITRDITDYSECQSCGNTALLYSPFSIQTVVKQQRTI